MVAKAVSVNSPFGPRPPFADSGRQLNPPDSSVSDLSNTRVGRFLVFARVGGGGMGEVYRGYDTKLKRTVALKRIIRAADENYRQRLWTEARLASQLSDPRIAAVYDVFENRFTEKVPQPLLASANFVSGWLHTLRTGFGKVGCRVYSTQSICSGVLGSASTNIVQSQRAAPAYAGPSFRKASCALI